jgi:hypothetical protein
LKFEVVVIQKVGSPPKVKGEGVGGALFPVNPIFVPRVSPNALGNTENNVNHAAVGAPAFHKP